MNKEEFIDKLFHSRAVFVDWDDKEYLVSDLMNRAWKERHDTVQLTETVNQVEYFVELMRAVLGGGYLIRGNQMPDTKPAGTYSSCTSGSTGRPKLISHNLENFIAPSVAMSTTENMDESSTFLAYLPTSTNAIFGVGMMPVAITNGRCVFKKFNPYQVVNEINKYRPTHATMPPGIYNPTKLTKEWKNADLSSFKYLMSGSNFTVPGFFEDVRSKGGKPFHGYGTTEIPAIMNSYPDSEQHLGQVWYPGAEWKSVDGELWCRWNHMEWWQSGDTIEVDPVHGPRITGRKDNQFKYRDFKIVPESYELTARQHELVVDAMLKLENHLVLYYEGTASPAEVEDLLAKHNPKEIMPRQFIKVNALPRSNLGKLDRKGTIVLN
jgi:long-subunit acyl-CoA synthetase (AMP-forming)